MGMWFGAWRVFARWVTYKSPGSIDTVVVNSLNALDLNDRD
jgi:hypothetical protein